MDEMNSEWETGLYEDAIALWGDKAQTDVAIEEMAELTKALIKYRRCPSAATLADVREEMADVGIMLSQLALIYGDCIDEEVKKLERLAARIEKARAEK